MLADRRLQRLSLAGLLLVVPQFLGSVFLVEVLHEGSGLPLATAGALLALTQVLGAAGRLGNGFWSDRAGSRLRPLRIVAGAVAAGFGLAALVQPGPVALLVVVLVPAAAMAISWNGLVFTAAGELAPAGACRHRDGRVPHRQLRRRRGHPVVGGLVAQVAGWPAMLALGTVAALAAVGTLHGLSEPRPSAPDVTPAMPRRTSGRRHGTVVPGH